MQSERTLGSLTDSLFSLFSLAVYQAQPKSGFPSSICFPSPPVIPFLAILGEARRSPLQPLLCLPHLHPLNPTLGGSGSCEGPEPGGGVRTEIQHPQGLWLL